MAIKTQITKNKLFLVLFKVKYAFTLIFFDNNVKKVKKYRGTRYFLTIVCYLHSIKLLSAWLLHFIYNQNLVALKTSCSSKQQQKKKKMETFKK